MSEGTHSTPAAWNATSKRKLVLVAGGTAVAVIAAAVMIQVFRAPAGISAENGRGEAGQSSGRASLHNQQASQPLARVGKHVITYDEVADECMARHGNEVLEKLINRTIIQVACEERGIRVTEDEVNREIVEIARKFQQPIENWLQLLQAERGLTPQQYRRDIIWPMLALKKLAGENVIVTEQDMQHGFERDYGRRVMAKMILLDNQRRALEAWEKANQDPDEFGALARQYSIEPSSKALEGDIPPIRKHSGNPRLEAVAFKLKPGEISPVIQIGTPDSQRWVILRCEGQTDQVVDNIETVREALYQQLTEEKVQVEVAKVFSKLKDETRVDNYVTNTSNGGTGNTAGGVRPASATTPAAQTQPRR